jgi:hypothetical protein
MNEKQKHYCMVCEKELDYIPQMCCNAFDCGCQGKPVEPPVCSQECYDFLISEES